MPRTIQLSDARYKRLVAAAQVAGYSVKPGPGSQLGDFIEHLLDNAPLPIEGDTPAEVWARWNAAAMPILNELGHALVAHKKGYRIEADSDLGFFHIEQRDL